MPKLPTTYREIDSIQAAKPEYHPSFTLTLLTRSIRKLIAVGSLAVASSNSWADIQINQNEIWLNPGELRGICAQDLDQDGDQDLFEIFHGTVTVRENTGSPESPEFSSPAQAFANDSSSLNLNRLGLTHCFYYDSPSASIDIDADGDLDLFTASFSKNVSPFNYFRNDGTTAQPAYIEDSPQRFDLPNDISRFIFRDIDHDGDQDFFGNSFGNFYENTGSPENALFVERLESPIQSPCGITQSNEIEFLVDLNNDNQWDILCRSYQDNSFEYVESSPSGYLTGRELFSVGAPDYTREMHILDVDQDNDMDILNIGDNDWILYTNTDLNHLPPQFEPIRAPLSTLGGLTGLDHLLADLDGDNDFDYIDFSPDATLGARLRYVINTGSNNNPVYEVSLLSPVLRQCNDSFLELANINRTSLSTSTYFGITDVALVDIDGDNDLDLFTQLKLFNLDTVPNEQRINVYCENTGSLTTPLFTSGIASPFGLIPENSFVNSEFILFADKDGDGDQDAWLGNIFYDNIGNANEPLYQQISHSPFTLNTLSRSSLIDLSGNGRIDSTVLNLLGGGTRLLYNNLEPATQVAAAVLEEEHLILVTNRPSQVQLQRCDPMTSCSKTVILPTTAQELSLGTGDFNADGDQDIVLAMIDINGNLSIKVFNSELQQIGSASGGHAETVSVSAGQFDPDPADEYVVSLVQADNRVAAISYNLDGSRVGKVIANQGKNPSVNTGKFSGTGSAGDDYVLAYVTPNNQLETATFRGDTSLIGLGGGGDASDVTVTATNLLQTIPGNEYIVSLIQSDGTLGLIGFSADGSRLGKAAGGYTEQPRIASGHFPGEHDDGLAVSLIQADKKPAILFFNHQGNRLAKAVGGIEASFSTMVLADIDHDSIDEAILVYIDEAGTVRWEVFGADGIKR